MTNVVSRTSQMQLKGDMGDEASLCGAGEGLLPDTCLGEKEEDKGLHADLIVQTS